MFIDALEKSGAVQLRDYAFARLESIEAAKTLRHVVVQSRARSEDVDLRQPVPQSDLVVVEIVRRGDLDATGPECGVDVGVGDDGNQPLRQRQPDILANQVAIAFVVRIHSDGSVAEHRLRARGRHYDMT